MAIGRLTAADLRPIASVDVDPLLIMALEHGFSKWEFTRLQRSHFLAQVAHESGGFYYLEEIASGEDYEGREDLGNTQEGDGVRYKGRGLIQVTGRSNYEAYGAWASFDAVAAPEALSQYPHCVDSAFWYWQSNGLGPIAEADDIEHLTRRVNGGFNGLDDRIERLTAIRGCYGC